MNKLFVKITIFIGLNLILFLAIVLYKCSTINNDSLYKIDSSIHIVFFGDSHSECAINDSLLKNTKNFAQSADTYFYIYYKLKKIIEVNASIDTVFLDYPNTLFDKDRDLWVYGDEYMGVKLSKYFNLVPFIDQLYLCFKNPKTYLITYKELFTSNYSVRSKNNRIYSDFKWGGYLYLVRDKIASQKKEIAASKKILEHSFSFSSLNYNYFTKIISICKNHNITLILFRPPLHELMPKDYITNACSYKKSTFKDLIFWDYAKYPLKDSEFGDLSHLNYKGANKFSLFIRNKLDSIHQKIK
jgi:hypothetical protein